VPPAFQLRDVLASVSQRVTTTWRFSTRQTLSPILQYADSGARGFCCRLLQCHCQTALTLCPLVFARLLHLFRNWHSSFFSFYFRAQGAAVASRELLSRGVIRHSSASRLHADVLLSP
jgi:hypothetical protein